MTARPCTALCGACGAPTKGVDVLCEECVEGREGMRDLLGRLTARVIGAETPGRTPLRIVLTTGPGYGRSTGWDTPRGEAANLPRMLREATARQTKFRGEPGVRTRGRAEEPSLAVDHAAGDHLSRLRLVVAELAIATARATGTGPERSTWGAIARWIDAQMPAVRRLEDAPALLERLREVSERAMRHVDRPAVRAYLGPCDQQLSDPDTELDLGPCPGEYRAVEGEAMAACVVCRAVVGVAARKRALLEEAASLWLTAAAIERLTAALGHRVAKTTVDSWGSRGQVRRDRLDGEDGPWSYPLADVQARVEAARSKDRRSA